MKQLKQPELILPQLKKQRDKTNYQQDRKRVQITNVSNITYEQPLVLDNNNTISKATDFINSIIHEYLLKKEYYKSLSVFQDEIDDKLKSKAYYLTSFSNHFCEKSLISHFNLGDKKEFFNLFSNLFPIHVRKREESIKQIEFQLQVYFTIFPLKTTNKRNPQDTLITQRLNEFKVFLEENKGNFKTNDFLSYFALPYITGLKENPAYKHLFDVSWSIKLKEKLTSIIKTFVPLGNTPLLYEIFNIYNQTVDNSKNNIINQIKSIPVEKDIQEDLRDEIAKLKKKEETFKQMLIQSQVKWNKLAIEVVFQAAEILNTLKTNKHHLKDVKESTIESHELRINKYDFFLRKNLSEFEKVNMNYSTIKHDESLLWGNQIPSIGNNNKTTIHAKLNTSNRKNNQSNVDNNNNKSIFNESEEFDEINQTSMAIRQEEPNVNLSRIQNKINQQELSYNQNYLLDIHLIKEEIGKLGSVTRSKKEHYIRISLILKDLRFRITKKKYTSIKQQTVLSIFLHDLFQVKAKFAKLLNKLFDNKYTIEETIKLLNVLSTNQLGRDYILKKDSIIEDLIKILKSEENDTLIRQNCLGILQKFTLRSQPQKIMLDNDMLGWSVSIMISQQKELSNYSIEYILAFIMNLSLSNKGRDLCVLIVSPLLKVLYSLLDSDNLHIRTCVHGILYSILRKKVIRDQALITGFKEKLEIKSKNESIDNMKKQIEYLLIELNKDSDDEKCEEEQFNDEAVSSNYEEIFEDDCNLNDTISQSNIIFHSNIEEIRHLHLKAVEFFILKFETDNIEEIKKINDYSSTVLKKKEKIKRINSTDDQKPISRPITPLHTKDVSYLQFNTNRKKDLNENLKKQEKDDSEAYNVEEDHSEDKIQLNSKREASYKEDELEESEIKEIDKNKIGYSFNFDKEMDNKAKAFKTRKQIPRTPE